MHLSFPKWVQDGIAALMKHSPWAVLVFLLFWWFKNDVETDIKGLRTSMITHVSDQREIADTMRQIAIIQRTGFERIGNLQLQQCINQAASRTLRDQCFTATWRTPTPENQAAAPRSGG